MREHKPTDDVMRELRARAEKKLGEFDPGSFSDMSSIDIAKLMQELMTHQLELEMQNEELRESENNLIAMRDQYTNLYDEAPIGYLTTDKSGLILQANITFSKMLGHPHSQLADQSLSTYIAYEDQDIYYKHRSKLLEIHKRQKCELRLRNIQGDYFWVGIDSVYADQTDGDGEGPSIRSVLQDIDELVLANIEKDKRADELAIANIEKTKATLNEAKEKEKRLIYEATVHSAQYILNNLLQNMLFFKIKAEKLDVFDDKTKSQFAHAMSEGTELVKKLSAVEALTESNIRASVAPKSDE